MVRGYELDAQAIELAKINAALNGVADRTNFEAGAIEKLLPIISSDETVIIDPPRSGLHPKVLDTLLTAKPKTIVYVSCKYQTFVKELTQFKSLYRVEKMEALDLFPQTPHVELVTKLVLR